MIKEEDLLPGTKALYGIEFESIIVDIPNKDYICIQNNRLYDTHSEKIVTDNLEKFMEDLSDYDIPNLFEYHTSGLSCIKPPRSDKRLEFASHALSPTLHKPSELFNTLERMRETFWDWTEKKYYLPDHGTISFLSDDKKVVYTTLTGGTHITISFPLTIHDNPITWKYFMWLFLGLVTMYQPIYVALNGAPSSKTKGSERQRTSGSVVIGSAYIYDIFTPESGRYEIFINSPSENYNLTDYTSYAHWNDKDLDYKENGPWRGHGKADIGNSSYRRSDSFKLYHDNSFITDDKEKVLNKQFYEIYDNLIGNLSSMTSNLIEFRFFDNEPIKHLENKFNLLIRMSDYAYEQSKNIEASIGIDDLGIFIHEQTDYRLNIRPLVNKEAWHDAALESMNEGMNAIFNEEFIDECYEFLQLTPFSTFLENPKLINISAIDLNKSFIDEMNKAEHHFSEYFQTENPTSDYSKKHQIKMLRASAKIAKDKKKVYDEEKARKEEAERQRKEKLEEDQHTIIKQIINENISILDDKTKESLKYIDLDKLIKDLRIRIYDDERNVQELNFRTESIIDDSLVLIFDDVPTESLNNWFKDSLLPDLRQKDPTLKAREDAREDIEDRNRERERVRERQLQREREAIEQQINFIANIVTKNIEKITDDNLKDLILTTIHLRKLSDTLRESIYVNRSSIQYMTNTVGTTFFVSTLDDVSMNNLNDESKIMLYKWFIESLLPDLESNIPELLERTQPQITTSQIIPQTEDNLKSKIRTAIIKTVGLLNERSQHSVITTISYTKLTDILYLRIYVHQQSFSEIEELSDLIIRDAMPEHTTRTFEEENTVRAWFKVGLISELRDALLIRDQISEEPEHIPLEDDEKNLIYESISKSKEQIDNNARDIIINYIDHPKLVDEIYTRIRHDRSTEQIKNNASLITQTSIFDQASIPENKKEIIDAWFVGILIPQLIQDNILNPLQETEEIPTTYATELEAVESEERIENETSTIEDIIINNIDNLENRTLKEIIKTYGVYNYLAQALQVMIYQKNYTTVDIENNIDILIKEGFIDPYEENYVQNPDVIKLLVTWIEDYLMKDLVEGTPLELGGLALLFG